MERKEYFFDQNQMSQKQTHTMAKCAYCFVGFNQQKLCVC